MATEGSDGTDAASPPNGVHDSNADFSTDKFSNPRYLHHSDNPGSMLVSQLLIADNYSTWSRAMIMALSAKNKLASVNGSLMQPDPSSNEYTMWRPCNHMVLSWLLNSIFKDLASSIIYASTASEVWMDLKKRLTQSMAHKKYQIKSAISLLSQETMSVAAYCTKMKSYWDELASYDSLLPVPVEH